MFGTRQKTLIRLISKNFGYWIELEMHRIPFFLLLRYCLIDANEHCKNAFLSIKGLKRFLQSVVVPIKGEVETVLRDESTTEVIVLVSEVICGTLLFIDQFTS